MRKYRNLSDNNKEAVMTSLKVIAAPNVNVDDYRQAFYDIGVELGRIINHFLKYIPDHEVMFSFANEDADWLGSGVMEGGDKNEAHVSVFWNSREKVGTINKRKIEISPIIKSYEEPITRCQVLVIVKSIINTSCVVKTQLNRLISNIKPDNILVLAPVMYKDAEKSLSNEFPTTVSNKFQFISFAIDDQVKNNTVIPGVGGQVYSRLGLGDTVKKNSYTPNLVIKRMQNMMVVSKSSSPSYESAISYSK